MRMKTYTHDVDGVFVPALSGETFDSTDPYSGEVWAKIARESCADIDVAVTAAKGAMHGEWKTYDASHRGKLLSRLAELIEDDAARLA